MSTNRYPGRCQRCGLEVPANAGTLENRFGRWVVSHDGPCPEISSGLGIGGYGSDDYNIHTEQSSTGIASTGRKRRNGGGQLWEPCPRCGDEPVHLDCGYCDRHCRC